MTSAAREVESGVRSVETQLNEAGNPSAATAGSVPEAQAGAAPPADQLPVVSTETTTSASPAHAAAGEPPRQGALPALIASDDERSNAAPDGTQDTFISHLIELRSRLMRSIIAIVIVLLCLFPWAKNIYAFLAAPLLKALPSGER